MSNPGALISKELAAKVHWSLGRCVGEDASLAAEVGESLIADFQAALEQAFRRGVEVARQTTGGGSGGLSSSDVKNAVYSGASG